MDSCAEESRLGIYYERRVMTGFSWLHFFLSVAMFLEQATNWITPLTLWSITNPLLSLSFSSAPKQWRLGIGPRLQGVVLRLRH